LTSDPTAAELTGFGPEVAFPRFAVVLDGMRLTLDV